MGHWPTNACPAALPKVSKQSSSNFLVGGPTYILTFIVSVFHESKPSHELRGLAIVDNGSGVTLLSDSALRRHQVPESCSKKVRMSLNTINGPCTTNDRLRISGVCVRPSCTRDDVVWRLGNCVSINTLPCASSDMATSDEIREFPPFKHLQKQLIPFSSRNHRDHLAGGTRQSMGYGVSRAPPKQVS